MTLTEIEALLEANKARALHLVEADSKSFSKIGGRPSVPAGFAWPKWNGTSLAFLAQLDLAEVPGDGVLQGLPSSGRLYFFYDQQQSTWGFDPKDAGSWQVIYMPADQAVAEVPFPGDVDEDYHYNECPVTFKEIWTYRSTEGLDVDPYSISDDDFDEIESRRYAGYDGQPHHQIGGCPDTVQNDDMELQAQLAANGIYLGDSSGYEHPRFESLKAGAQDWQLLLQVDTDEDLGMMWGDCGLIYFWIRKQDLAKGDFSRTWMILQCS